VSKKYTSDRRRRKPASQSLGLWLGIGGGVLAVVIVVVAIVLNARKNRHSDDPPKDSNTSEANNRKAPEVKRGGQNDPYTIVKRIETNISLIHEKGEPANFNRRLLDLRSSADGNVIVAASSARYPRKYVINRGCGQVIAEYNGQNFGGLGAFPPVISPNGKFVIYEPRLRITNERKLQIRDTATRNILKEMGDAQLEGLHNFDAAAFSANSDTLYAIAYHRADHVLAAWNTTTWEQVFYFTYPENTNPIYLFTVSDGTVVTVGTARLTTKGVFNPLLHIFDVRGKKEPIKSIVLPYERMSQFALTPDGKTLAYFGDLGDGKRFIGIMDVTRDQEMCTIQFTGNDLHVHVSDMRFLPNGNLCLATDYGVTSYDSKTGKQKAQWKFEIKDRGRNITTQSICANGEIIQVLDGDRATILVTRLKE